MHYQVQEGPINCLALNRDCSQAVVAGRNDNLLASAATNGAVVVWDLNKVSRSKQEHVFTNVHRRSVNKVVFHSHESDMLLSGSQDGYIKLFDLRKKEPTGSFHARDGVRDIQYNPNHYFMFAAALENGNIQIWDMRNAGRCERQFTAHGGPVFSIDWHTTEKMWMATAGRDKLIKVWDLHQSKSTYTVQTMASVAKIKWRPQRRFHISSCSLIIDFSVNVWDIRRPYIPFASFTEHKDIVTGIVWRPNDPHTFFSSSKDSTIYQHVFKDASRPADKANPVSIDINIHGDLAFASGDKGSKNNAFSQSRLPALWKRQQDRGEQFTLVTSVLNEFEHSVEDALGEFSMKWFIQSAQHYKLTGRPLGELCEHNAKVAQQLQRAEIVTTWKMLKAFYSMAPSTPTPGPSTTNLFTGVKTESLDTAVKDSDAERKPETKGIKTQDSEAKERGGDTSTDVGDEDSDGEQTNLATSGLTSITRGIGTNMNSNFFFSDGELDGDVDIDYHENFRDQQDWSLSTEAFPLRQDIEDETVTDGPQLMAGHLSEPNKTGPESPSSANESELNSKPAHQLVELDTIRQKIMTAMPFMTQIPGWHFTDLIRDMLHSYADRGDVQTAVSIIIVLGDKIKPHLDENTVEQWFMSYVDLLGRFRLWTLATLIIKLSGCPEVGALNQRSTTFHTNCSRCNRVLQRAGWVCDRCTPHYNTCSICHLPVRGLYIWCQGCSHGGHQEHLLDWFQKSQHCPTGCGHLCEFT